MHRNPRLLLPLIVTLALLALLAGASGCGSEEEGQAKEINVEGTPVDLGPVVINVVSSRYLDRTKEEDAAHLAAQPLASPGFRWFGVFLKMKNQDNREHLAPALTLTDATGESYSAYPSDSPNTLRFGEEVAPGGTLPRPDKNTPVGPVEGELVIFRPHKSAFKNRPLTLHIETFDYRQAAIKLGF
jgi:hypothetical protein